MVAANRTTTRGSAPLLFKFTRRSRNQRVMYPHLQLSALWGSTHAHSKNSFIVVEFRIWARSATHHHPSISCLSPPRASKPTPRVPSNLRHQQNQVQASRSATVANFLPASCDRRVVLGARSFAWGGGVADLEGDLARSSASGEELGASGGGTWLCVSEAWESLTPTQGAMLKRGSPSTSEMATPK